MNKLIPLFLASYLLAFQGGFNTALAGANGANLHNAPSGGEEKLAPAGAESAGFLQKTVEEFLATQMPPSIEEWKISSLAYNQSEKIPKDFDESKVVQTSTSPIGDMRTLSVEFLKNNKIIKRLSVRCKVEMFASAVVAKEVISRGTPITEEMVEVRRVLVDSPLSDLSTEKGEVAGHLADRNLPAGKLVRKSQLQKVMDIKAGDLITIVAKNDTVQLTARGVAKKDGLAGDLIPVVNLRSNKRLFAKILDGGTVEVAF